MNSSKIAANKWKSDKRMQLQPWALRFKVESRVVILLIHLILISQNYINCIIIYLLTFLGNLAALTKVSLLSRHFFPIPMSPCADERFASVRRSVLSPWVVRRRSAEFRVVSDSLVSGRVVGVGMLVVAVMGVVERVRGFGKGAWVVVGEVRRVVGFWSRPLHTWKGGVVSKWVKTSCGSLIDTSRPMDWWLKEGNSSRLGRKLRDIAHVKTFIISICNRSKSVDWSFLIV